MLDEVLLGEILSVGMFAVVCAVLMLGFPVAFSLAGTALALALIGPGSTSSTCACSPRPPASSAPPSSPWVCSVCRRCCAPATTRGWPRARSAPRAPSARSFRPPSCRCSSATASRAPTPRRSAPSATGRRARLGHRLVCRLVHSRHDPRRPVHGLDRRSGIVNPKSCPALLGKGERVDDLGRRVATALLPPGILILAVLGSILAGIATPTEAAAVGCVGAFLLAARDTAASTTGGAGLMRRLAGRPIELAGIAVIVQIALAALFDLRMQLNVVTMADAIAFAVAALAGVVLIWGLAVALVRLLRSGILTEVMRSTVKISSMVFVILLGASVFSLVFRGLGGDRLVADVLGQFPGGAFGAIAAVMAVMFVLGFFIDFIEIIFVVVPIVGPVIPQMDVSPVWLGVMIAIDLQTSFLTPPFGFALFFLRGVAPPEVKTSDIYRGIIPFVAIQLAVLGLVGALPPLATWLPRVLFP